MNTTTTASCEYPGILSEFIVKPGKHQEVGKLIEKWVLTPSSRPKSPKDVADELRKFVDIPAGATVKLEDWDHLGSSKKYVLMMPTADQMRAGKAYADCQVAHNLKYDLREHRAEYADQINNNPPNTDAADFRYYRIAEYTFSHCY